MVDSTGDSQHTDAATKLLSPFSASDFDQAIALLSDDIEVRLPFQDECTRFWSHAGSKDKIRQLFTGYLVPHPLHIDKLLIVLQGWVSGRSRGLFLAGCAAG